MYRLTHKENNCGFTPNFEVKPLFRCPLIQAGVTPSQMFSGYELQDYDCKNFLWLSYVISKIYNT